MKDNFVARTIKSLETELNIKVVLEPSYKFGGYIEFDNGIKSYFLETAFDINEMGASRMARDKGYSNHFLKQYGYPIPQYATFGNHILDKYLGLNESGFQLGLKFCYKIGFPVIIKPNDGSKGSGVYKVSNKAEYELKANILLEKTRVMMVQKFVQGNDYRILVFNGKVICAYQRIGLKLVGDGIKTIIQHLENITRIEKLNLQDPRILLTLEEHNLTYESVLPHQEELRLMAANNLSLGGSAIDKTKSISEYFKEQAVNITKQMGLTFCGVDIMTESIESEKTSYSVIEINSSPGSGNFARLGKEQFNIIRNLYADIIKTIKTRKGAYR